MNDSRKRWALMLYALALTFGWPDAARAAALVGAVLGGLAAEAVGVALAGTALGGAILFGSFTVGKLIGALRGTGRPIEPPAEGEQQ